MTEEILYPSKSKRGKLELTARRNNDGVIDPLKRLGKVNGQDPHRTGIAVEEFQNVMAEPPGCSLPQGRGDAQIVNRPAFREYSAKSICEERFFLKLLTAQEVMKLGGNVTLLWGEGIALFYLARIHVSLQHITL